MSWLTGWYNFLQDEVGTDDFVDKLARRHMVTALALTTVVLAGSEYIGSPINCFTPNGYTGAQGEFINSVCHAQSLYYVYNENWNDSQPLLGAHLAHGKNIPMQGATMVNYYKYAPIVLMLMCFFFALPNYIWQVMLNLFNGLNLENLVEYCTGMLNPISSAVTEKQADLIADRLLQYSQLEKSHYDDKSKRANLFRGVGGTGLSTCSSPKISLRGCRLFGAYLFTKVLHVLTVSLTIWGLSVFLDVSPWDYFAKIVRGLTFRPDYASQFSGRFPTVTICQYTGEAQVLGKLLRLTNICVIPLNVYYDKIFAVLFCLFIILLVLLTVSIFVWVFKCLGSQIFFKKYLNLDSSSLVHPALNRLDTIATLDMIFVLRLIENNSDGIVAFNVVRKLYEKLAPMDGKKESFV